MQGNDLDNRPAPRIILVAEGALILIEEKAHPRSEHLISKGRFDDAAALWQINDPMVNRLWQLSSNADINLDVVTFLGPDGWAEALADKFDREYVPVRSVFATDPRILARKVTFDHSVARVYTPFPEQALYYGPKGRVIKDVNDVGRL